MSYHDYLALIVKSNEYVLLVLDNNLDICVKSTVFKNDFYEFVDLEIFNHIKILEHIDAFIKTHTLHKPKLIIALESDKVTTTLIEHIDCPENTQTEKDTHCWSEFQLNDTHTYKAGLAHYVRAQYDLLAIKAGLSIELITTLTLAHYYAQRFMQKHIIDQNFGKNFFEHELSDKNIQKIKYDLKYDTIGLRELINNLKL